MRYHINGAQYIDERVATYHDSYSRGEFAYYLAGNNYSLAGEGNSVGTVIRPLSYDSSGDFAGAPVTVPTDFDGDNDVGSEKGSGVFLAVVGRVACFREA